MQQIERYGVIALVFLLVTIVAVSFWGDKKSPGFWARLTGRGENKREAPIADAELAHVQLGATERAVEGALPLSPSAAELALAANGDGAHAASVPYGTQVLPHGAADGQISAAPTALELAHGTQRVEAPLESAAPLPATIATPAPSTTESVARTPAPSTESPRVYVVQKGDSLGAIARKALGKSSRWPEIQALNGGLDPKSLRVGMKLALPAGATVSAREAPATRAKSTEKSDSARRPSATATPAAAPSTKSYVVRAGDSLHKIAESRLGDGGRWKEIVKLNPGLDPKRLSVGQTLKLPADGTRALVAQAAAPAQSKNLDKPRVR